VSGLVDPVRSDVRSDGDSALDATPLLDATVFPTLLDSGSRGPISPPVWTGSHVSRIWASSNVVSVLSQSNLARICEHRPPLIGAAGSLNDAGIFTSAPMSRSLPAVAGIPVRHWGLQAADT
jgi:hypothetical protein